MNRFLRFTTLVLIFALALATIFAPTAFADSEINRAANMVGKIVGDSGSSFSSIEDEVQLSIDPSLIVKGDILKLYSADSSIMKQVGRVVVISNYGDNQKGKLINASREIYGETFLAYELPEKVQLNKYVPFMQSLADLYLADPARTPLSIAVIDVVNQYGDKTAGGDIVLNEIRASICSRPQFSCVSQEKLAEYLWGEGVVTSRNIDRKTERGLRDLLGVEVAITGHIKETNGAIDLILMAKHTAPENKPRVMWRRFAFSYDELKLPASSLSSITTQYHKRSMGKLAIKRVKVKSVDGMKVEYFSYENLGDWIDMANGKSDDVIAGDFFVRLDGAAYPMSMNGLFYNDRITAGKHRVTFGYYPTLLKNGRVLSRAKSPVQKNIEISVTQGETFNLDVIGKVEGDYGILTGDSW